MITQGRITTSTITSPIRIFSATTDGSDTAPGQTTAITAIVLCNTGAPNLSDETVNLANVNIYLVKSGASPTVNNLLVSNLPIPAGETVFFSEERLVLDPNDSIRIGSSAANLITVTVSSLAL